MLELVGLVIDTLVLVVGTVLYLCSRSTLSRVLSLQSAMFSLYVRNFFMGDWYPSNQLSEDQPVNVVAELTTLLIWGGFLFLPGLEKLLLTSIKRR